MSKMVKNKKASSSSNPSPEEFPLLYNLSGSFLYKLLPCPLKVADPEFVYVPMEGQNRMESIGTISGWNMAWEAGQFRTDICTDMLPEDMKWLDKVEDRNIYLLPHFRKNKYSIYSALYHLLPQKVLNRFNIPIIAKGNWPASGLAGNKSENLPADFDERLSKAFAYHIWPLLNSQSGISSFGQNEPLKVLSHNLNYWLPYAYKVAENRLNTYMDRHDYESDELKDIRDREQSRQAPGIVDIRPPLTGGPIWQGEDDAWNATNELVNYADKEGSLRSLIDAIKSHRVEDDFSNIWSFAKEDFERKMFSKRSKFKISFVDLNDTIPVHSGESEVHEKLLWENFIALLDPKEKQIVICLRNGTTKLGEIAQHLGYANHSPISKALDKIQKKAKKYLE